MNPKTTGVLFLVAVALASFVYFYEIEGEEGRRTAEEQAKRLFPDFAPEDVSAVELTASDGAAVRAERRDDRWQLVAPLAFPADSATFDSMAAALAQIIGETAIEDPQGATVYGLDADEREVRFVANEREHALRIGDKTPVGANTYVARAGESEVYTVPTFGVNAFTRSLTDLRDKRILDFDRGTVNRIEASWPDGRVVLVRGDDGWELQEPVVGPADEDAVENLLSKLAFLRADGFDDDPPDDTELGLDRPAFAVRLTGSVPGDDGGEIDLALAIGSLPQAESRLVRGAQNSLYRIGADRLDDFPTNVTAYRFKQLAEFSPQAADRIDILFHSAAGESVAIQAERMEDGWTSQPESFQPGTLAALAGALSNLRAVDIAADSMGADELRGLELDPPNAVFRVFGATGDDAETDPSLLAEIHLGALRGSAGIIAQRAGDDVVYVLDYALAEKLPLSHEAFANRFRAEAEPPAEAAEAEEP